MTNPSCILYSSAIPICLGSGYSKFISYMTEQYSKENIYNKATALLSQSVLETDGRDYHEINHKNRACCRALGRFPPKKQEIVGKRQNLVHLQTWGKQHYEKKKFERYSSRPKHVLPFNRKEFRIRWDAETSELLIQKNLLHVHSKPFQSQCISWNWMPVFRLPWG